MMKILSSLLVFGVVGVLGRGADIDINRIKRIPNQVSSYSPESFQDKGDRQILRSNDYDDHSSWYEHQRSPISSVRNAPQTPDSKTPVQIHKPREDPRLFYQSDAYIKEYGRNINDEVTFVYPPRQVVQAGEYKKRPFRKRSSIYDVETFSTGLEDFDMCVKCPHDRTLVAKASSGRVVLQNPVLEACSGRKAPKSVRFVHMHGPKIGSLLEQGSHMVIGRIMYKTKNLQLCKMQVHVVTQGCITPKYLTALCTDENRQCNFTCTKKNFELSGPTTQVCGEDMSWKGELPICKARTWCELPPPPEHGRVSCQGATAGNIGTGLVEGSRCRVRCARGYRSQRVTPVCRRGAWTHALVCQPIRKRNALKPPNTHKQL